MRSIAWFLGVSLFVVGAFAADTVITSQAYVDSKISKIELTPGPQGEQGIQGEQGPQGLQGEKGDTGTVGSVNANAVTGKYAQTMSVTDDGNLNVTYDYVKVPVGGTDSPTGFASIWID